MAPGVEVLGELDRTGLAPGGVVFVEALDVRTAPALVFGVAGRQIGRVGTLRVDPRRVAVACSVVAGGRLGAGRQGGAAERRVGCLGGGWFWRGGGDLAGPQTYTG